MTGLEYRLLGSLEVLRDGDRLALGGHKQRSLLALLLLDANRVVSTDRLIDALWPEQAPPKPNTAVQIYVSQLRKLLPREALATEPAGYRLHTAPAGEHPHDISNRDQLTPGLVRALTNSSSWSVRQHSKASQYWAYTEMTLSP